MRLQLFLAILFLTVNSFAINYYELKNTDNTIYNSFIKQGVPTKALKRIYDFLNESASKTISVKAKTVVNGKYKLGKKEITLNKDWIAVIDFSKPSDVRRLYIMNVKTGQFSAHHVAHGKGSGVRYATKFSNINNSKMSSLGLYIGGGNYSGRHGKSLRLHGLDPSNDKSAERDVVIHSASYVTDSFLKQTGRLGRSWGCPAVSTSVMKKINTNFSNGGIIYAYHKDLADRALKSGKLLEDKSIHDDADIDYDGEEETERAKPTQKKSLAKTSKATKPKKRTSK